MPLSDATRERSRTVLPTSWIRASRLDNSYGQEARLAVEIITECQYSDGTRRVGRYWVTLTRGQSVITYERAREVMGVTKKQTARRAIARVCVEMGWTFEPLTTAHSASTPPSTPHGGDRGDHRGDHRGAHIGTLITVSNYDNLTQFGDHRGDHSRYPDGTTASTPPSTPYGTPSYSEDPMQGEPTHTGTTSTSDEPKPDKRDDDVLGMPKVVTLAFLQDEAAAHLLEGDTIAAEVRRLFVYWCEQTKRSGNTQLTPSRERAVRGALKHSTRDDISKAIRGCASSDYHMANGYTKLDRHICKDRDKVEQMMGYEDKREEPDPDEIVYTTNPAPPEVREAHNKRMDELAAKHRARFLAKRAEREAEDGSSS